MCIQYSFILELEGVLEHPEHPPPLDTLLHHSFYVQVPMDVGHKVFAYTEKRLFVTSGVMLINYQPGYRVTELVEACHTQ